MNSARDDHKVAPVRAAQNESCKRKREHGMRGCGDEGLENISVASGPAAFSARSNHRADRYQCLGVDVAGDVGSTMS